MLYLFGFLLHFISYGIVRVTSLSELKPLLGILREKFPKKMLGTVGADLGRLVKTFANGHLVQVLSNP